MKKEIIISVIIIIGVIILDIITSKYTKECVSNLNDELGQIRTEIKNEENNQNIKEKVDNLKKKWNEKYDKLAYYIEHDELEKIYLYIQGVGSNIETEEYAEAISEIDKCVYILEHIEEKYRFDLKNIF